MVVGTTVAVELAIIVVGVTLSRTPPFCCEETVGVSNWLFGVPETIFVVGVTFGDNTNVGRVRNVGNGVDEGLATFGDTFGVSVTSATGVIFLAVFVDLTLFLEMCIRDRVWIEAPLKECFE